MSPIDISDRIQTVFRTVFEDPSMAVTDTLHAGEVERWDSLLHITLIMEVEKAFGVRFRNAEVARLKNVGDLKTLVAKYVNR